MKKLVTRADLEKLLDELHIGPSSIVLLQADLSGLDHLVGSVTTLVETLFERIGPKGCIIVPAFTMKALDPAVWKESGMSMEMMDVIRDNHPGYSSRTMPADVWSETAAAFLLHTKVKRTEHPVYSFAWYGPLPYKPALDTLDYPISFHHILQEMKRPNAVNLLIGVEPSQSIFPLLVAHEEGLDVSMMQSAFVRRVKKTFEESFLTSFLDEQGLLKAAEKLNVETARISDIPVYKIYNAKGKF